MIVEELRKVYATPRNVNRKKIIFVNRRNGVERLQERCAYEFVLWRDRLIDYRGTQIPISRVLKIEDSDECRCGIKEVGGITIAICGKVIYPPRGFQPSVREGDVIAICDKKGEVLVLEGRLNGYDYRDLWCYVW